MGRIKELRELIQKGEGSDNDKDELKELEDEAKEDDSSQDDEEKAIDKLAEKLINVFDQKKVDRNIVDKSKVEKETGGFTGEYEKMGEEDQMYTFYKALLIGDVARLKVMSTGVNADGGFLVPTVLRKKIVEEQRDDVNIRSMSTIIDPCPATYEIDQLIGRPKSKFRAEKAIKDTSTATFAQISLTPYSLSTIVPITNELVQDAEAGGSIVSLMTRLMAVSISEREDEAFAVGTGVVQPTGINNYAATISRAYTTPANVGNADTLIECELGLGARYRRKAAWLMNTMTLRIARQLKDTQNRYLFQPDVNRKFVGTLLGYPIVEQNNLPVGTIWFGDFKGYFIGDRGGLSVAKSTEATLTSGASNINLFERNMIAIRVEKRVDGELADLNSFAVITGFN